MGFAAAGENFGNIFKRLQAEKDKKEQDTKDEDFLQYLVGEIAKSKPTLPADIPNAAPIRQEPSVPVAGPQLPPGVVEPNPATAPTQSGQSMETPYSPTYIDKGVGGLLEQKKAAAQELFSSPENTLNLMIEAKKRGTGPGVGNILEFIQGLHKERATSAESDKKRAATAETTAKQMQMRSHNDEARLRSQERIADLGRQNRIDVANIGAGASKYSADHRGKDDGAQHLDQLSTDELYTLMDGYQADLGTLQQPSRADYDSYDATSLVQFREDYNSYDKARSDMQAVIRKIKNTIAIKEKGGDSAPPSASGRGHAAGATKIADNNTLMKYMQAAGGDKAAARAALQRDGWSIPQ